MRAFGEEIKNGCECIRGERRGRLQCGADIPAMDGEFKDASMRQGVHGDNAPTMIAGLVPLLWAEGGEQMREGVPGMAAPGQQVRAKTLSKSDGSRCEPQRPLPPFLLRECLPEVWRWEPCRRRGLSLQSTGDAERETLNPHGQMRHDITDFPEGTGARRGPGVRWQGGKVLLQPLELGLEDGDTFCLCSHDDFPPW